MVETLHNDDDMIVDDDINADDFDRCVDAKPRNLDDL